MLSIMMILILIVIMMVLRMAMRKPRSAVCQLIVTMMVSETQMTLMTPILMLTVMGSRMVMNLRAV